MFKALKTRVQALADSTKKWLEIGGIGAIILGTICLTIVGIPESSILAIVSAVIVLVGLIMSLLLS